ncbi:uncharacterized protein METZ01_LOCUS397057, partial [marine metagenome]
MEYRLLGKTNLKVSRLGIGLVKIGNEEMLTQLSKSDLLLNTALDSGINFLDTAACYGNSEEVIGKTVSHRRSEYVLASKAGHSIEGHKSEPWSYETIVTSVERSLKRMKTEYLDIIQLHTCDLQTLAKGDVIDALQHLKTTGKTRFIGYSGDEDAAEWAVKSKIFDTLQTSLNLVDQHSLRYLGEARRNNMGVIIKRPIANATWDSKITENNAPNSYVNRAKQMQSLGQIIDSPNSYHEMALGFVLSNHEVDT